MKRFLSRVLTTTTFVLVGLTGCMSETTQAQEFTEKTHYQIIDPPIPTQSSKDKVEVAELFWYGCPHCYNLEPIIEKYLEQKPENVEFKRVPAMLSPRWAYHAKLYYVGLLLDPKGEKGVHAKIFEALQKQRRNISNDDQLRRFFESIGYTLDEVNNILKSMELDTYLKYAATFGEKSGAESVPTIIINGKYLTGPVYVGMEGLIDVINFLTKKETESQ